MHINWLSFSNIQSKLNDEISKSTQNVSDGKITRVVIAALVCIAAAFGLYQLWQWHAKKTVVIPPPAENVPPKVININPPATNPPTMKDNQDNAPPDTGVNMNQKETLEENPKEDHEPLKETPKFDYTEWFEEGRELKKELKELEEKLKKALQPDTPAPIEPDNQKIVDTLIPIKFTSKVRLEAFNKPPANIEIYDTGKVKQGYPGNEKHDYPVYRLVEDKTNKVIGSIAMKPQDGYMQINRISTSPDYTGWDQSRQIKFALFEFAVRRSFESGLEGKVRLKCKCKHMDYHDSYFRFGFRYTHPLSHGVLIYNGKINPKLCEIDPDDFLLVHSCKEYLDLKENNKSTEKALEKIQSMSTKHPETWQMFQAIAKNELGREPNDPQEIIEHGVYLSLNTLFQRCLYQNCTGVYGLMHNDALLEVKLGLLGKLTQNYREDMVLSDEAIAKWKAVIEAETPPPQHDSDTK